MGSQELGHYSLDDHFLISHFSTIPIYNFGPEKGPNSLRIIHAHQKKKNRKGKKKNTKIYTQKNVETSINYSLHLTPKPPIHPFPFLRFVLDIIPHQFSCLIRITSSSSAINRNPR